MTSIVKNLYSSCLICSLVFFDSRLPSRIKHKKWRARSKWIPLRLRPFKYKPGWLHQIFVGTWVLKIRLKRKLQKLFQNFLESQSIISSFFKWKGPEKENLFICLLIAREETKTRALRSTDISEVYLHDVSYKKVE